MDTPTTAATIAQALSNWTELATGVINLVQSNTILFTGFCLGIVGGAVGLVKRFI